MEKQQRVRADLGEGGEWIRHILPLLRQLGEDKVKELLTGSGKPQDPEYFEKVYDEAMCTVRTYSREKITPEQQAKTHGVDLEVFQAETITTKEYQQGAKIKIDGKERIVINGLYYLSVKWMRKKPKEVDFLQLKQDLREQIQFKAPKQTAPAIKRSRDVAVEIMVTDLHLGKVGFDPETLKFNWSLDQAGQVYNDVIQDAIERTGKHKIDHFILPVGNDHLNIDTSHNTTTRGTPQMAGVFWHQMFRYAKDLTIGAINELQKIAPVYVYFVSGNHDKDSTFSLGEAVGAYFEATGSQNVIIQNEPLRHNFHKFGNCALGFTHFNAIKPKNAHTMFNKVRPDLLACKHRAIHGGHLHKNMRVIPEYQVRNEDNGITVEICPSLSPVDRWHSENLYIGNLRRSKTFIWHKEHGLINELYYNL